MGILLNNLIDFILKNIYKFAKKIDEKKLNLF